jgi:UDP-N-acetylglucosamine 3-dehydrogenase
LIAVGVVGLGAMGQHHARLYSELNCKLVGVVDADIARAREFGEKYNTKYYTDYRELFSKVEAVSVAVPTTLHHTVAMDFLNRGVHCLVEKPIAFSMIEAREMVTAADKNKVSLAIGHIERFNPAVVKLKQLIEQGNIGKLLIISTKRAGPAVLRIRDVGIVIDSATHDIGVVKYLIGTEPIGVFSRVGSVNHPKGDYAIVILDFVGTTACIEVNWFTPHKVRTLVATGSEGIAYLDYIDQKVTVHSSGGAQIIEIPKTEPLRLELEDFLRSIERGVKPAVDGIEGSKILEIALEASQKRQQGI